MNFRETTFQTARLDLRELQAYDIENFHQMMSNPKVMSPIPQPVFSRQESEDKLQELMSQKGDSAI